MPSFSARSTSTEESFSRSLPLIDFLPGLVLLLAGLAKAGYLRLFAKTFVTLFGAPFPLALFMAVGVFSAEMTLGCLLFLRPGDASIRRVAAGLFVVFAGVQMLRIVSPAANPCGCFGLLQGAAFLRVFSVPKAALAADMILALLLISGGTTTFFRDLRTTKLNKANSIQT